MLVAATTNERLAGIEDLASAKQPIVVDDRADIVLAGDVGGGEDRDHAGRGAHRVQIERDQRGMAVGGVAERQRVISIERHDPQARLDAIRDLTDGRGADVVMEFTGHPAAFGEGLEIVRRGGRYLVVGQLGEGSTTIKPSTIVKKNVHVIGSFSGDARTYWKALDFVSRHQSTKSPSAT